MECRYFIRGENLIGSKCAVSSSATPARPVMAARLNDQSKENIVADMDPRAAAAKIAQYPDLLVGVKSAHFSLPGWAAVERLANGSWD